MEILSLKVGSRHQHFFTCRPRLGSQT